VLDHGAVDRLLVQIFLEAHQEAPQEIILDLDATDDPLHGKQEGLLRRRNGRGPGNPTRLRPPAFCGLYRWST
jgi:hypothetical protein